MSEQGEQHGPHTGERDDWWSQLYDADASDTGRARASDTLDDRFASVTRTVGDGVSVVPEPEPEPEPEGEGRTGQDPPAAPPPDLSPPPPPAQDLSPSQPQPQAEPEPEPQSQPQAEPQPQPPPPVPGTLRVPRPRAEAPAPPSPPAEAGPGSRPEPQREPLQGDGAAVEAAETDAGAADPGPAALPTADPAALGELVPDTALDGARYGSLTLRAASLRGEGRRRSGALRGDALLTASFGSGESALLLIAVATGTRTAQGAHRAAREACHSIGAAVGRSHVRLAEDILAARRSALKSGLNRLTDRTFGKLRAQAAALGLAPEQYTADLRCLLLPADPRCRTRVFFGVGAGGLFRLRDGGWQDIEPGVAEPAATGGPVLGFGAGPEEAPRTMHLGIAAPDDPAARAAAERDGFREEPPAPAPSAPFRFRASVAQPGDALLLCSPGFAEPMRAERAFADRLAARWAGRGERAPGTAAYLADVQLQVKGYEDDRTAVTVWET